MRSSYSVHCLKKVKSFFVMLMMDVEKKKHKNWVCD